MAEWIDGIIMIVQIAVTVYAVSLATKLAKRQKVEEMVYRHDEDIMQLQIRDKHCADGCNRIKALSEELEEVKATAEDDTQKAEARIRGMIENTLKIELAPIRIGLNMLMEKNGINPQTVFNNFK